MFGRHWETALGTIVDTRIDITRRSSSQSGSSCADREFVVDVTTLDGDRFRTKVIKPRLFGDWWTPRIGTEVRLRWDRRRGKVTFDTTDPAISFKAQMKARENSFNEILAAAPSTPRPQTVTAMPSVVVGGLQGTRVNPDQLNDILAAAFANATVIRMSPPQDRTP